MKRATAEMLKRIFKVLEPPPNITMTDWSDKKRVISSGAMPGQWKTSMVPYMREIMNAISDPAIRKVVLMTSAQVAKTHAAVLNTIGYFMDYDPSPILVIQPTLEAAQSFSKEKLTPMLNDTPVLRGKVSDKRRNSKGTILYKEFPGGYISIVGANSSTGLASRSIRILLADEIDRYPPTANKEGDPLMLAEKRTSTYWNSKQVYMSTPTNADTSRIAIEYENSTKEVWTVPCPACGHHQPLEWSNVLFDKENFENIKDVSYICAECGVVSGEYEWKELYTQGKFKAEFPDRKVRGFHLNALASLIGKNWSVIVEEFLMANKESKKGDIEKLKVWTNTVLGQVWIEEGESIEDENLYNRREKYNCEVPSEVICLTAGIDTQDDRFEIEVVGWGYERESWGIKYDKIYGNLKQQEIWNDLDAFLNQTFSKADGTKLRILRACIDLGGHFANEVEKFCKTRIVRGIIPIRGVPGDEKPLLYKSSKNNNEKVAMYNIGVDSGKAQLYGHLLLEKEGANYCHFPKEKDRGYDRAYFKGLTAEKKTVKYRKGKPYYVWVIKDSAHRRNEPLDCRNYAQAALEISRIILKRPENGETPPPTQTAPRRKGRRVLSGGI